MYYCNIFLFVTRKVENTWTLKAGETALAFANRMLELLSFFVLNLNVTNLPYLGLISTSSPLISIEIH